jgi:hypothetical protein
MEGSHETFAISPYLKVIDWRVWAEKSYSLERVGRMYVVCSS